MADDPTGEVTDLLQGLIRNRCVNDGSDASGHERRNADLLVDLLEGPGLDLVTYEPAPGRASVLARIEGSDPAAPSLLLLGHTDVVPANPDRWQRDPFGAELVDGEVWGRGAVDMLNLTASMAVAVCHLARRGWRPKGTLSLLAVADEEALGAHGAGWLTAHERDAVGADYVITEPGSVPIPRADGARLPVTIAEKGSYWCRIVVGGTSGHASQPHRSDNAVVTAAEVVRRIARYRPEARIHQAWERWVRGAGFEEDLATGLLDPAAIDGLCETLPVAQARLAHACTHTTFAPTMIDGGVKTNVIPDRVTMEVDIRTLPGDCAGEVSAMVDDALGDLAGRVTVEAIADDPSTSSPADTPLWDELARVSQRLVPGSKVVPSMTVGATDARFFRRIGATAYGFGLLGDRVTFEQYAAMFHGDDERVDQTSLRLSTECWIELAERFLG
ncbi:MAG TPA: M20/M25/M40 family metallo-hydrolase [Acidimicrobiales bacterium]|jgi:acetylornithine deacetylase/succinyl-diaminopimelate desuccinylase-like protein|nr:M20/M25/M40 family metallo-hydrolase [Acidimicrobiales bacterium]